MSVLHTGGSDRAGFNIRSHDRLCAVDRICELRLQRVWSDWLAQQFRTCDAVKTIVERITNPEGTAKACVFWKFDLKSIPRQLSKRPSLWAAQANLLHDGGPVDQSEICRHTKAVARHER